MKTSELITQLEKIGSKAPFDAEVVTGDDWMPVALKCVYHEAPYTFLEFEETDSGKCKPKIAMVLDSYKGSTISQEDAIQMILSIFNVV